MKRDRPQTFRFPLSFLNSLLFWLLLEKIKNQEDHNLEWKFNCEEIEKVWDWELLQEGFAIQGSSFLPFPDQESIKNLFWACCPFHIPVSTFWNMEASNCFSENLLPWQALNYHLKSSQMEYKPNIFQHPSMSLGQNLWTWQFYFDL